MMMETIIIRYLDLPCKCHGYVRRDADGNYNIYINARLSIDMQRDTVQHELRHVERGDFDSVENICNVEEM